MAACRDARDIRTWNICKERNVKEKFFLHSMDAPSVKKLSISSEQTLISSIATVSYPLAEHTCMLGFASEHNIHRSNSATAPCPSRWVVHIRRFLKVIPRLENRCARFECKRNWSSPFPREPYVAVVDCVCLVSSALFCCGLGCCPLV